jgi:RimJ/RimL family protein N-acetyltransferase
MVRLEPMSEAEFRDYLEPAIADYAEEHIRSGQWGPDQALEESRREFTELLPDGLDTPDQYLYSIKDATGTNVGMLWFAARDRNGERSAFVYDVRIGEQFQRRGYGSQAFHALEAIARDMGITTIGLHVFGHNTAARALYEKLGFATTNLIMKKTIAQG